MIDIHCHILPHLDDGPQKIEDSLEMARLAARDGITHIVATPHVNGCYFPVEEDMAAWTAGLEQAVGRLNRHLKAAQIPVRVFPGAEVSSVLASAQKFTSLGLNKTKYLLVEFPHSHLPRNARDLIFHLIISGYRPIIAHPERNPSIIRRPEKLIELCRMGARVQITAASLAGGLSPDAARCAVYLIKKAAVDFIATDAHSKVARPPVLSKAFKLTAKIVGQKKAQDMVLTNPQAVLQGAPIGGNR